MGFGVRLLEEGNDCRIWIRDKEAQEVGDGLVPKANSLEDILFDLDGEKDVVFFDGSGNGALADYLRSRGIAVLGGSIIADRMEHDRGWAQGVMKNCGIGTPESFTFKSWEEGSAFAKNFKERLVFKPSKNLGELAMSHVCYDTEDLLEMLDNAEADSSLANPEFDLQEFVEGTCVSSEGWFDGNRFIPELFNHTLERKELMEHNHGPSGGCTGNIVWACSGECPICLSGVRRLEPFLRRHGFIGMCDLNAVIDGDGRLFGLEFTPRCGYDATPTLAWGLLEGELGHFVHDVAKRQYNPKSPRLRDGRIAGAVRVTIPPWPSEEFHAKRDIPIRGLEKEDLESVYLFNVKSDEDKPTKLASAGAWGILLLFVSRGDSIGRALSQPYKLAEKVRVPNKQYREDLVKEFKEDLEKLETAVGSLAAESVA
jgi:phosphoribosylamine-glycine ligase